MNKGMIIIGGAQGIGRQICLDFLTAGYHVACLDMNEQAGLTLEKECANLYFFLGNVKDQEKLAQFVDFALGKLGRIDVLISNACRGKGGILSNADYDDFGEVLSIGLQAPYELARLCKQELCKNKGHILNIASSRAFQSEPNTETYAATKGGLVALTHALAISLGPEVLVNCIAPGWIHVNAQETISRQDISSLPAGKVGTPKDVSDLALFLCQQTFITGETIVVDGGMSKRMIYHNEWYWQYQGE